MIFADRKYDFVYAMRLSPCAGCGGKFIGRDLYTVMGWHESLTFFEGDRLCRALGSRVPLFTLLPRRGILGNWDSGESLLDSRRSGGRVLSL
jgi:hypothetical protein